MVPNKTRGFFHMWMSKIAGISLWSFKVQSWKVFLGIKSLAWNGKANSNRNCMNPWTHKNRQYSISTHDVVNSQMAWRIAPGFQPEMHWLKSPFQFSILSRHVQYLSLTGLCLEMSKLSNGCPFPLSNDKPVSNTVRVEHQPISSLIFWFWLLLVGSLWPLKLRQGRNLVGVAYCPPGGEIPGRRTRNSPSNRCSLEPHRKQDNQEGASKGGWMGMKP